MSKRLIKQCQVGVWCHQDGKIRGPQPPFPHGYQLLGNYSWTKIALGELMSLCNRLWQDSGKRKH